MHPILFSFGSIKIFTYGVFLAAAFFLGLELVRKDLKRDTFDAKIGENFFFVVLFSSLIGARLFYVFFNWSEYLQEPLKIFKIWEGGLVFYGGFLFALIASLIFACKHKIKFLLLMDIFSPMLILGQAIGRLGCFFAGCCYGKPTTLPWGVVFPNLETTLAPSGIRLHPTQIYESIADLVVFFWIYLNRRKKKYDGQVFVNYVLGYALVRFIVEFFRGDARGPEFLHLPATQWMAAGFFLAALLTGFYLSRKKTVSDFRRLGN
ncbi:MAG: prolipoprotein diacylglyceryl transferase [Elusimicrobiota bacterium]